MCEVFRMANPEFPSNPSDLARMLVDKAKLSVSYASELARAKRKPSLKLAMRLERDLKIPCQFWFDERRAA